MKQVTMELPDTLPHRLTHLNKSPAAHSVPHRVTQLLQASAAIWTGNFFTNESTNALLANRNNSAESTNRVHLPNPRRGKTPANHGHEHARTQAQRWPKRKNAWKISQQQIHNQIAKWKALVNLKSQIRREENMQRYLIRSSAEILGPR